jgi:hypothetical protein
MLKTPSNASGLSPESPAPRKMGPLQAAVRKADTRIEELRLALARPTT